MRFLDHLFTTRHMYFETHVSPYLHKYLDILKQKEESQEWEPPWVRLCRTFADLSYKSLDYLFSHIEALGKYVKKLEDRQYDTIYARMMLIFVFLFLSHPESNKYYWATPEKLADLVGELLEWDKNHILGLFNEFQQAIGDYHKLSWWVFDHLYTHEITDSDDKAFIMAQSMNTITSIFEQALKERV